MSANHPGDDMTENPSTLPAPTTPAEAQKLVNALRDQFDLEPARPRRRTQEKKVWKAEVLADYGAGALEGRWLPRSVVEHDDLPELKSATVTRTPNDSLAIYSLGGFPSLREASEWGQRAVQALAPRVGGPICSQVHQDYHSQGFTRALMNGVA